MDSLVISYQLSIFSLLEYFGNGSCILVDVVIPST